MELSTFARLSHLNDNRRTAGRENRSLSIQSVNPLDPHHPGRSHYVHNRLYRSHKHISCLAAYQPGPPFGSAASRDGRGHLLLGLPSVADSRRPSGQALECEEIYQRSIGCMGPLCDRLRLGPYLSRTFVAPVASGSGGERGLSGHFDPALALVFPFRACARQRILAAVLAGGRNISIAFFWMDSGPLELAGDAGRRRLVTFFVAGGLACIYSRPSLAGVLASGRRTRFPGGNLASRVF